MKKALIVLALLLLLPVLGACQNSGGKQPLVIYNWGEYLSREQDTYTMYGRDYEIDDVIRLFEEAYPQYAVTYLTYDA